MTEKRRVFVLDALRGAAVLGMIVHHGYVLLNFMKGIRFEFFHSVTFDVLQMIFVCVFLLVSGICTNYSRNIAKRGTIIFAAAILVTLVTAVLLPIFGINGLEIYFGILHMFGLAMLLYSVLRPLLMKCDYRVALIVFLVLFFVYWYLTERYPFVESPLNISMIFGFPSSNFYSADYYPLFPYFFMFLAGAMLGRPIKEGSAPARVYSIRCKPLEFVGRHSLLIYIVHQPVIFLLICAVDLFGIIF